MRVRTLIVLCAVASVLALPGAHANGTCADDSAYPGGVHPGGEWRRYGQDLANTRNQPNETVLNAANVGNVTPAWVFDASAAALNGGSFQNTPVIADGCLFLATSTGWVFALNADTMEPVWDKLLPGNQAGDLQGGVITGSPTVTGGRVYVAIANYYKDADNGPTVVALDQATGDIIWQKPVVDPAKGHEDYAMTVVSAPVVMNGLVFQGIMASESELTARGGYAILDAATGDLIVQDFTVSDDEYEHGYRGASIWCTPAADADTGFVYACGGNPASKQLEARYSNALLKVDMNRLEPDGDPNPDFGTIVAAYKGHEDHYYPGLDRQPVCQAEPTDLVWSPTCVQLDLDFGASPSLYSVDVGGTPTQLLGDLQKSGVYHAVYADNMQGAWSNIVGAPAPTFNAASGAVDGSNVYTAGTPPSQIVGLSRDRGGYQWVHPLVLGPTHFQSVSVANGVVYAIDNIGSLSMIDAANGLPIKRWPLTLDTEAFAGDLSSQGVAIARNTIYVASGSFVVAYRLP